MLINLNSPEKAHNVPCQKTYLKNPLIPGPDVNCNIENNNPFDLVANSAENWDPFELVLHESLRRVENAQNGNNPNCSMGVEKSQIFKSFSPGNEDCRKNGETVTKFPKIRRSHSLTENIKFFRSPPKKDKSNYGKCEEYSLNNSLTDKIKEVVKQRFSKCIVKAIKGSISQPDLYQPESLSPIKSINNTLSKIAKVGTDLSHNNNISFSESHQYTKVPDASFAQHRSFSAADYNKEELKDFFEEAKKISFTLNNMAITSPRKGTPNSDYKPLNNEDDAEDLMSVKPPWEENSDFSFSSESDDSSLGLPKVKLFYLKKKEKKTNEISMEELEHYKKRIRASIDRNMSCDEEGLSNNGTERNDVKQVAQEISHIEKDPVVPNKLKEERKMKEKDPLGTLPVSIPSLPEANNLWPKKRGNILKKGPLKAIMPLQKMTKTLAGKISPMRKNSFNNASNPKMKDSSFSSSIIYPVASSTPKSGSKSKASSNVTPESPVELNKRSRLSRRDAEPERKAKVNSFRRSVSLSSATRNPTTPKLPFSSVNANVKANKDAKANRPHTAPSKTNSSFGASSPKPNELMQKRNISYMAVHDKENRMQAF